MMNKLGLWLFNLACKLNPAIPLAMRMNAEQQALELASHHLAHHAEQAAQANALALYQQAAAARAARQ